MDLTKEYIELCSKAGEIQKIWQSFVTPPHDDIKYYWNNHYGKGYEGSFYYRGDKDIPSENGISCVDYEYECLGLGEEGNTDIWLPRTDQLLELANLVDEALYQRSEHFAHTLKPHQLGWLIGGFADNEGDYEEKTKAFDSPEKCLLAYVMEYKYNKVWNSETKEWENK